MRKIRYIFFGLIAVLYFSCCPDVEPEIVMAEIEEFSLLNYEVDEEFGPVSNENDIASNSYSIVLLPNSPSLGSIEPRERKGLFLSPDCSSIVDPSFVFEDSIVALKITSQESLSQNHIAGDDITGLFDFTYVLPANEFGDGAIITFTEDRFERLNVNMQSGAIQQGYDGNDLVAFFVLKLNLFLEQNVTTIFTVEFIFESGRRLSAKTPEVTLIP